MTPQPPGIPPYAELRCLSNFSFLRGASRPEELVERAKGVLMHHQGLAEDEAYRLLRQTAMNQGRRLVDVAQAVLAMAELLPRRT